MSTILTTDKSTYDVDTVQGAYDYLVAETGLSSSDLSLVEKLYMNVKLLEVALKKRNCKETNKEFKRYWE